jgi:hypothetical protein
MMTACVDAGYDGEARGFDSPDPTDMQRHDFAGSAQPQRVSSAGHPRRYPSPQGNYGLTNGYGSEQRRPEYSLADGYAPDSHAGGGAQGYGQGQPPRHNGYGEEHRPHEPAAAPGGNGAGHADATSSRTLRTPQQAAVPPVAEERLDGKEFFRRCCKLLLLHMGEL